MTIYGSFLSVHSFSMLSHGLKNERHRQIGVNVPLGIKTVTSVSISGSKGQNLEGAIAVHWPLLRFCWL